LEFFFYDLVDNESHNPLSNVDWDDETNVESTNPNELDRSISEDLSSTSYTLIDELFLELFYRGIKQDTSETSSLFLQLNQDQRENFRKIIKHFCNLDKRLDDMLDL
jgi:hypothetical protein